MFSDQQVDNDQAIPEVRALFFPTGKMAENPDLEHKPPGIVDVEHKYNEFVVYDESQVKLQFLV